MNRFYFYIIEHKHTKMLYAGSKTAKDADPTTFMNHYTTSSNIVNRILDESPNEVMFIIRRVKTFSTPDEAYNYETRFLRKVKAKTNPSFFNCHENELASHHLSESYQKWLDLHGVENAFQIPEIQEKARHTNMKRRGVPYPSMSPDVIATRRSNSLKRYGVKNVAQLPEVQAKMRATTLERYGVENVNESPIVRTKTKRTCQDRYGGNAPAASLEVQAKIRATTLERYGVESVAQLPDSISASKVRNRAKRERDVVSRILACTSKKQRRKIGLGRGWYQRSTEDLEQVLTTISQQ